METSSDDPSEENLSSFHGRFQAALDEGGFLGGVRRLLIAASAGADSTALALLHEEAASSSGTGIPEILLGHVHHGIRGTEADEDESFVRSLAKQLGWNCLVEHVSVPRLVREEGLSLEVAARRLRYETFCRWAREHEIDAIALGHHLDDQRETLMLRLARGTGVKGLSGIPAVRLLEAGDRAVRLIRPLLDWNRSELRRYLRLRGQRFREDSSNSCLDYPRNVVRHSILPLLEEKVHPGCGRSLERLASQARQLGRDLESLADRALEEARVEAAAAESTGSDETEWLDARSLSAWPPSVLHEVLAHLMIRVDPEQDRPSETTFTRFESLLKDLSRARLEDLGGGIFAELRYGTLAVYRVGEDSETQAGEMAEITVGGGAVAWKEWLIGADRRPWSGQSTEPLEEWVDEDRLGRRLVVRCRAEGDVFRPLGASGKKKLKEFFREHRVSPRLRDTCPLVASGGGDIVWVVGQRLGHSFRVRPETRRTVHLYARRIRAEN